MWCAWREIFTTSINQHNVTNDAQCKFKLVPRFSQRSPSGVSGALGALAAEGVLEPLEKLHWKMDTEVLEEDPHGQRTFEKDWEQIEGLLPHCLRLEFENPNLQLFEAPAISFWMVLETSSERLANVCI